MVEEVKEQTKPPILSMDQVMRLQLPLEAREALEKLDKEHVSNYRLHPEYVAVCEISMASLDKIDGIPGFYDVVTGTPASQEHKMDGKSLSERAEFTPQGLRIADRFKTVINNIPEDEWINEWIIVPLEEWLESRSKQADSALLSSHTEIAGIMRRADEV